MPDFAEDFSGGLVTVRDPATLKSGELTQADNAVYLPYDPAIVKAKLRTKYNSVALGAAGNVKGLRYAEFDAAAPLLIAHEGTSYFLSRFSAETGVFNSIASISSVGNGSTLDIVQYNDRYVTMNGVGENKIINPDGTSRKHGMYPVPQMETQPVIASGVWSTDLGTGFYFFLYTEAFTDPITGETVESAFTGTPLTTASSLSNVTTQAITITQNVTPANSNASKWRIYMAGPQDFESPVPNLNEFRLVAEVAIETTTYTVQNLQAVNGRYPGTVTSSGWSAGNSVSVQDNVGNTTATNLATLTMTNFGFSGITGTITGFQVFIRARLTGYTPFISDEPQLRVDLTSNGGTIKFPGNGTSTIPLTAIAGIAGGYQIFYGGSPTFLWGRTGAPAWPLTDVNGNANFGVVFRYETAVNHFGSLPTIDVDFVRVAVYSTGSAQPVNLEGAPYRVVNISIAGITTTFPADGMPPVSSTGDVFEDQLVLNDIQDRSMIRYSIPSKIGSFPSVYFVNFETKTQDQVTCIRRLGNKLLVGCTRQLYRMNYLPRETDAEYDRGRAYEAIDEGNGIVGPMAATLFSPDGESLFLAYISHAGPRLTDGFQSRPLNSDLDWENTVRIPTASDVNQYLNSSCLVDYPAKSQLWFYYTAPGATTNNRAIVFHYSKTHRKQDGTMKATGPITVAAFSACTARLAGYDVLMTGQSGGFTYVEDRGYSDASGGTPLFVVKSREIYIAGLGQESRVEKVYTRHRQDAGTTIQLTVSARRKDNAQFSATAKTFTLAQAGTSENAIDIGGDSHQFKFEETANSGFGARLTGFSLDIGATGKTEARS